MVGDLYLDKDGQNVRISVSGRLGHALGRLGHILGRLGHVLGRLGQSRTVLVCLRLLEHTLAALVNLHVVGPRVSVAAAAVVNAIRGLQM